MKKESIDIWLGYISGGIDLSPEIYTSLKNEVPLFISWVGERTCNLQCNHCIFQKEKSYGENAETREVLLNLASQISAFHQPIVIHEGRVLRKWHLPIMAELQQVGALVGMIDNGTYVRHIQSFQRKIHWLDISIDGTEEAHNLQRNNDQAHAVAFQGIKHGREVAEKVTSLFTITSLNYSSLYDACSSVIEYVDEFHIIPVSPVRPEIMRLETTQAQMQVSWQQTQRLVRDYPGKVFIRAYQYEDLVKIALINPAEFTYSLQSPVGVSQGRIMFEFQGVRISYMPKSLSINETIVIDIDNWYRLPYSISYTISELIAGVDKYGRDISAYSMQKLTKDSNFIDIYPLAVDAWWKTFGHQSLSREKKAFSRFLPKN